MTRQTRVISGEVRLEYDLEDGWVMILDRDGGDLPGVLVSTVLLDRLIIALGELRQGRPVDLSAIAGAEVAWEDNAE